MGFGETRTSANHKSREITNFAHHLSELFLVGNWQRERKKEKSGLRRKLSVHIGFWDDAIGLTVSNSKVFSSDFQSFIFTSVLIIYKAVLKKNWDCYETRCGKTVEPWFSGWINWLQVCNITLHLRTWILGAVNISWSWENRLINLRMPQSFRWSVLTR